MAYISILFPIFQQRLNTIIFWLIIFCLILVSFKQQAAENDLFSSHSSEINFSQLDTERDLSSPVIFAIEQDSLGYIWIATQNGLNRYDGVNVRKYFADSEVDNSLSNNWVSDVYSDKEGRLWIVSKGGINLYLPEEDAFKAFVQSDKYPNLPKGGFRTIAEGINGVLWFGSETNGLVSYDVKTDKFMHFKTDDNNSNSLSNDRVNDLLVDSKNRLWVATNGGGINVKLNTSNNFQRINTNNEVNIPSDKIRTFFEDDSGQIWVGTSDAGLFSFNLSTGVVEHFLNDPQQYNSLCHNAIYQILEDNQKRLWIATEDGLCEFDKQNKTFTPHRKNTARLNTLIDNRVHSLFQDQGGVIWVGTFNGVSRWNANLTPFPHVSKAFGLGQQLSSNVITSFAQDSENILYIGTWGGGLNYFDPSTQNLSFELADEDKPHALQDDGVMSLLVDSQDNLWVGTVRKGLHKRKKGETNFEVFQFDENDDASISSNGITKIIELSDGTIAVSTYGGGVNFYQGDGTFIRMQHDENNSQSLTTNKVLDLHEAEDGTLWIATHGGGVTRYFRQQNYFVHYQKGLEKNSNGLMSNHISGLLETSQYLWFATQESGVVRLNKQQLQAGKVRFEHITTKDGLVSNATFGMLEDANQDIWISSSRGLSRLTPTNLAILNFNKSHGLQGNDFNSGSYFKGKNGRMYFGGSNGFNSFMSNASPINHHDAPVRLTKFSKFNKEVPLHKALRNDGVIELLYSEYFVEFEFAALDFTQPSDNKYQYKMAGLNDNWVDANNNSILFSSLDYGEYTFRVRGANNDGKWGSEELVVPITVLPPPWHTIYAYLFYALLVFLSFYYLYRRQIIKSKQHLVYQQQLRADVKQRTLELEESNDKLAISVVETEAARGKAEQAAKAKSEFLATMSHEIRTPMNSILGMSELLTNTSLSSVQQRYISTIYSSGTMLLQLINDILDFSKLEVNKLQLELTTIDLHNTVEETVFLISGQGHEKNLEVLTYIAPQCPKFIQGDALRLRQILINLVGNGIKFTEFGQVNVEVDCDQNNLFIKVIDTGIGMSKVQMNNIFHAFKQADSSTTRRFGGTGLGLSITKTLVELMKGTIAVNSTAGQGSEFIVTIPKLPLEQLPIAEVNGSLTNIEVGLIVDNEQVEKMAINCIERLNLSYIIINSPEQLLQSKDRQNNRVFLVEGGLTEQPNWLRALEPIATNVVLLTNDVKDPSVYMLPGANFINKPIISKVLFETILQAVSDETRLKTDSMPLKLAKTTKFKANILLVEDVKTNQLVATEMLKLAGCSVDIADHGGIALEKIKNTHYDLVFMDCHMPVMDGFEATEKIREWQKVNQLPRTLIVALTAGTGDDYFKTCLASGMDDCMLKPYTAQQLFTILQQYLLHLSEKVIAPKQQLEKLHLPVLSTQSEASHIDKFVDVSSIESIRIIELNTGRNIYGRVLATFQQEMVIKLPKLIDECKRKNATAIAQTAHAMKSLAANVGAKDLKDICQAIEMSAKQSNLSNCSKKIALLEPCYQHTLSLLIKIESLNRDCN